jgi:putative ABC transport system permease protein
VIVVSRGFARRVFGERNPLGEWITVSGAARQVVGIAEDGPSNHLHEDAEPFIYFPFAQVPSGDVTLMVETTGEPVALAQAVRRELRDFDALATIFRMTTLREHMDRALSEDRMSAALTAGLCGFALLLTGAGLFGVVQYAVNRRTREFGLRAALGAQPAALRRMVLLDAARMAAWGVPIGLILLSGAAYYLRSIVLGVSPLNPALYLASAAAVLLVALMAAWIPARRTTRVDPLTALRYE